MYQVREPYSAVQYLAERIDIASLLGIPHFSPPDEVDHYTLENSHPAFILLSILLTGERAFRLQSVFCLGRGKTIQNPASRPARYLQVYSVTEIEMTW